MEPPQPPSPPLPQPDSRGETLQYYAGATYGPVKPPGLIAWGVIFCLIGGFSGCVAGLAPLAMLAPPPERPPVPAIVLGVLMYLFVAAAAIWLGIACFRSWRWVGKVVPALAWPIAIMGMVTVPISTASLAFMEMPQQVPAGFTIGVMVGSLLFGIGVMIALPVTAGWYFSRGELRQRLVELDPRPNWTNGRSTALLALVIWMALAGLAVIGSTVGGFATFFGLLLEGPAAVMLLLVEGAILLVGACLAWQRNPAGWAIAVLMTVVIFGSTAVSLAIHGADPLLLATLTQEQRQLMENNPMVSTPAQLTISLLYLAGVLAALVWVRPRLEAPSAHEPEASLAGA